MKILSKATLAIAGGLATFGLAQGAIAQSAPEPSTCLFFEDANYGGAHFGLYNGDALKVGESVGTPQGFGSKRVFVEPQWAGRVSSHKVPPNCSATVVNDQGQTAVVGSDLPVYHSHHENRSIAFGCACN